MNGLALLVQQGLGRDPHGGELFCFRGRRGSLMKVLWHDGVGMSLYVKRLDHGRFVWPTPADGAAAVSAAQLGYLLEGIDWRNPRHTWRPSAAGWCGWPAMSISLQRIGETRSTRVMVPEADEVEALRTALAVAEARAAEAEAKAAEAARERAVLASAEATIAALRLEIEKLRRALYGTRSERKVRLLDQLELQLEELEATATEDELAAEAAAAKAQPEATVVKSFDRRKPMRGPLPAHLPRERVVIPAPCSCPDCGGKLVKLGEDVTETLEVIPRQWKVVQTVREKFTCRSCEKITQPPAPFHPIARGRAGASLLAMVLHGKFGNHLPLNRQSESFAREGIDLDVSTLADWVGACTATLAPLVELIRAHVFGAARIHGDDTTVPVLAKVKTRTGRLWTYVRDDRPFGGDGEQVASIGLRATADQLILNYRVCRNGEDWTEMEETVPLARSPCRFGGMRSHFVCPGVKNGRPCTRRVTKLYLDGQYFLCRHCYDLAYASRAKLRATG